MSSCFASSEHVPEQNIYQELIDNSQGQKQNINQIYQGLFGLPNNQTQGPDGQANNNQTQGLGGPINNKQTQKQIQEFQLKKEGQNPLKNIKICKEMKYRLEVIQVE